MMVAGGAVGFVVAIGTSNQWLAETPAMLAAGTLSLFFAVLPVRLRVNQVAIGPTQTILGTARGSRIGKARVGWPCRSRPGPAPAGLRPSRWWVRSSPRCTR
jgi:ABC-type uncharacterized transport system permease subunit